jgi:hypothetical protein
MWTKVYHSFLFILLLFPHLWCVLKKKIIIIIIFPDFWCRATPPDKGVTRKEGPCLVPCEAIAKRWPNSNNSALIHPRLLPHGKKDADEFLFYFSFYIQDLRKWMK